MAGSRGSDSPRSFDDRQKQSAGDERPRRDERDRRDGLDADLDERVGRAPQRREDGEEGDFFGEGAGTELRSSWYMIGLPSRE